MKVDLLVDFGGPAGSSFVMKTNELTNHGLHMACKDGECVLGRRAILYRTSPRQIVRKLDRDTFKRGAAIETGFSKISRDPVVRFLFYHKQIR